MCIYFDLTNNMFLGLLLLLLIFCGLLVAFNVKRNKNVIFLAAFLFLFSLYGLTHYIVTIYKSVYWGAVLYVNFTPLYLLSGPFLYFYVRNSLTDRYDLSRKDLLHFIPFVVHAIGLIPYLFSPFSEKIDFIKKLYASPELIINAQVNTFFDTNENFIIRLSLLIIYATVDIFLIHRYSRKKLNSVISLEKKQLTLRWLYLLNGFVLALVFFYGLFIVKLNQFPGNVFSLFNDSLLYATAACLALILISLLVFPHILYGLPVNNGLSKEKINDTSENKRKSSALVEEENDPYFLDLKKQIEDYLNQDKPYLKKQFKMADLIVNIGAPQHHISYCLNYYFKKSFPELKTDYRMSWSKKELLNPYNSHTTIEGIAEKAGYSSKSAFYKTFKDYTGLTPQEYQKQVSFTTD